MAKKKIKCSFSSEEAILTIGRFLFTYENKTFTAKVAGKEAFVLLKEDIEKRLAKGNTTDGELWSPEEYLLVGLSIYVADGGIF